jgi:hypothetical protein
MFCKLFLRATLSVAVLACAGVAADEPKKPSAEQPAAASPWGISSSSSSFKNHAEWLPKMAAAGVATVRLFPEWRQFEPMKGTWQWDRTDALLKAAAASKIEINAILMGSPPGAKGTHAFPMNDLDGWSNYVSTVVKRYGPQVRY